MNSFRRIALAGLLTVGMALLGSNSEAQERSAEGASFNGKVSSVDKSAQTVVVDGKTYQLIATSQVKKDSQPASINDLAAGDQVSGRYKISDANKMEVLAMDITKGTTATTAATTAQVDTGAAGASFSGTVSAIDPTTKTIMVGSQSYQGIATSMIKRDGQLAGFNDLAVGDQVSGRYKRSDANKLEILTMDVTKGTATTAATTASAVTTPGGATFSGRVSKVDPATKTVTIGSQSYQGLATTVYNRNGQPASFDDIRVGAQLDGRYKISDAGRMEMLTANIGGGTPAAVGGTQDTTTSAAGASFQGDISRVNAGAQTIRIGNQTYRILPTTVITRAGGRRGTLANLEENQKVTGTYRTAADGSRELLTLQIERR